MHGVKLGSGSKPELRRARIAKNLVDILFMRGKGLMGESLGLGIANTGHAQNPIPQRSPR
jgi:hypothetical protein